jgi:hypothetical protein
MQRLRVGDKEIEYSDQGGGEPVVLVHAGFFSDNSTVSDESNRVLWIDWDGSMITEAAKLCERIRPRDFGHLGSN